MLLQSHVPITCITSAFLNIAHIASKLLQSHVKGSKVLLITNDRISSLYMEKYETLLRHGGALNVETLVLPDGEENKSMDVLALILDKALECTLDRKATFVALGGGVIGDMVGFAAAIYQRGVNFIQVSLSKSTICTSDSQVLIWIYVLVCLADSNDSYGNGGFVRRRKDRR